MSRETFSKTKRSYRTHQPDKSFYASWAWRKFRAEKIQRDTLRDAKAIGKIYKTDHRITRAELVAYLGSGKPYCRASIQEGRLIPANILDHIQPIRSGGNAWDETNMQWLSYEAHQRKRNAER